MAKIDRYDGNLKAFASEQLGSERTLFGQLASANDLTSQITAEFLRGWGIVGPSDQPSLQDFNAAMYTNGQLIAYLHQMGIAEYNAAQEYFIGSITQEGGEIYTSLTNGNVGNVPASSPAQWLAIGGATKANASTTITAGLGLSGGGDLSGNRTISANFGTTAGTVMEGNDSRITGAAQKSANLSDLASAATARQNLGLGTAATRDVGESSGNVMGVGAFGLGAQVTTVTTDLNSLVIPGLYSCSGTSLNTPAPSGAVLVRVEAHEGGGAAQTATAVSSTRRWFRVTIGGVTWNPWRELCHTGNILTTAGQSTIFPMSQKAVTDAINNSAIGVGQTWQDVTGSRLTETTYTNSTGKPIQYCVSFAYVGNGTASLTVGGVVVNSFTFSLGGTGASLSAIVPAGSTYSASGTKSRWTELR